jgi:rfaE bifunctional protein nucleotidyltransferase chain/domain
MSITPLDTLQALRAQWRAAQQRLVLTNGVFDLLHVGHVAYLEQARALGDVLVVAINSDSSTRALKGPQRPLMPEDDRARMLAALRCVDYVTLFAEHTAEVVVAALQPDYYVKGGDYARAPGVPDAAVDEDRLPEARVARASGGQVVLLPYRAGYSTSALIERIVRSASEG